MDFIIEEISPVKKSITVNATAEEVNASLKAALNFYRKDLALDGFRKGKVPASIVQRRFGDEMKNKVLEDFLGDRLEVFLQENDIVMVSRPEYSELKVEENEAFTCTVSFETMPSFEIPAYAELEVEQDASDVSEEEVNEMITRLLSNMAEENVIEEVRAPKEGEAVTLDFAGFENGEAIADVKGEHFNVVLGEKQVLPDFEQLVYSTKLGEENEGKVTFPDDYGHAGLAGKTIDMKIKLGAIRERKLPALDEEFAGKMGLESVEKLQEAISESIKGRKVQGVKAKAQQKLMDMLIEKVDFELPETMVKQREERILGDARVRMAQYGDLTLEEKTDKAKEVNDAIEEMRPGARKDAELFTKMHILLLTIARKENISATDQEADMQLYQMAMQQGQDFTKVRDAYMRSGLMGELKERIIADKAMSLIYDKAKVVEANA